MLLLLKCITCFSSVSSKEIKLIVIDNWIFHASDILRSFMISFKYGLILPTYSSVDGVLSLSPLLSYTIKYLPQNLPTLTGL